MDRNLFIKRIQKTPVLIKDQYIIKRITEKDILDVGCVGQDKGYESESWLHGKLKKHAKSLTGVDIDLEKVNQLRTKGFTIYGLKEFEENNLTYETVVIADVIEHVNDIVSFLSYYLKYMKEDGEMIITTPNPFSFRQFMSVFLYGKPSVNPEHTSWLDPNTMYEIISRMNLKIEEFYWLDEYSAPRNWKDNIIFPISKLFYNLRRFYAPNYVFVLKKM